MSNKVIAVGASAGGLDALRALLRELPKGFDAPIVVAIHSQPESQLARVLDFDAARGGMQVRIVQDGDALQPGIVHVLPGATHGFFRHGGIRLSQTVRNSGFRPSVDALFMSLASEYGSDGIAVVLSGTLNDGMRGAQVIYDMGGITLVQDPSDAHHAGMPQNVINADHPSEVLSATELGVWLRKAIGT
jgi:two-component system chemotaxis response regulator CheB